MYFIAYIFESIETYIRSMHATRTTSMGGWVDGWVAGMGGWVGCGYGSMGGSKRLMHFCVL